MIFENFCHQAIDATAHIRQKHEHVRAVVAVRERTLDRVDLAANAFYTSNQFLFFLVDVRHLVYHMGV